MIYSTDYSEKFMNAFRHLSDAIGIDKLKVTDELSSIRVLYSSDPLTKLFSDFKLVDSPNLTRMVEIVLLALPHNMIVESGFSVMKSTESPYQSRMDSSTYDARRVICSYFDRNNFENFEPPPRLLKLISESCARYKQVSKEKKKIELPIQYSSSKGRREIGVYNRRTTLTVTKELTAAEQELAAAEKAVEELRAKKRRLESEKEAKMSRVISDSQSIIDSMFPKK